MLSALTSRYEKELKEAEDKEDVLVKPEPRKLRANITKKNTTITGLENKTTKTVRELASIKILLEQRAVFEEELVDILAHQVIAAPDGSIRTLHLIISGLK